MSKKELALWIVLADFVALTLYAVYQQGLLAVVPVATELATGSAWGAQIAVDFLLAVAIALGFVVADARKQGITVWPFVVLTLTLGSIGPLAYLVRRERALAPAARRSALATA